MDQVLYKDFQYIQNSELDIKKFKNSSIVITGATGLIGSLITKFFLYLNDKAKFNVKIYAVIRNRNKANKIYQNYSIQGLKYIITDLEKDDIYLHEDIDYIIHAAAITKSKLLISKPVDVIKTSLNGTEKLLDLAEQKHVKAMVYVSSMEVYGQPNLNRKITESDLGRLDLTNPRSCYPEGKRMCECMATSYASQYNVNVKIARLAQTFGAGILPGENRVFAQFAKSTVKGNDIILHTQGKSEGNYVYTADAIKAILILLLKGNRGQAYNVVNESSHTTIKNMAEMVIKNFGKKSQKVIIEIPAVNMGYAPDIHMKLSGAKLRQLGWKPTFDLVDSYQRMINYMYD